MERRTFALRALPGERDAAESALKAAAGAFLQSDAARAADNFSIWGVEDMFFGYGEYEPDCPPELWQQVVTAAQGMAEPLCPPGSMRLMYHDIGLVRADKSLIRHRVFATKLKPGCEAEYKRRHDALVEARGGRVSEGPDSNFTIWCGRGYIFGYCEKVRSFDHKPTEAERAADIAWETRQLEIMDWLTDDVDWITGERHEPIRRIV